MPIRVIHVVEALGSMCEVFRLSRYAPDGVRIACPDQQARRFAILTSQLARAIRELRPDVPELFNTIDGYVLPSLWQGLSNSLLEEIAAGMPVIAYDTGRTPETVLDGESGLLFPLGDFQRLAVLLLLLIRHRDFCERLGESAWETIRKEFSRDTMARSHEQMYDAFEGNCAA